MEQKDVPFACADAPDDEPFILHVKAAFAEEEARKIIARTKAALAVAKARGKKLGTPANLTDDARRRGAEANTARARARQAIIRPEIAAARAQGFSMRAIAERVGVATAAVLPHTACGVVEWAGSSSLTANRSPQRVGSTRARYCCERREGCITVVSMKSKKILLHLPLRPLSVLTSLELCAGGGGKRLNSRTPVLSMSVWSK